MEGFRCPAQYGSLKLFVFKTCLSFVSIAMPSNMIYRNKAEGLFVINYILNNNFTSLLLFLVLNQPTRIKQRIRLTTTFLFQSFSIAELNTITMIFRFASHHVVNYSLVDLQKNKNIMELIKCELNGLV